jgi:hypothetical protein
MPNLLRVVIDTNHIMSFSLDTQYQLQKTQMNPFTLIHDYQGYGHLQAKL